MGVSVSRVGAEEVGTDKVELVRNSVLSVELTGDQCRVVAELVSVFDLEGGEVLVRQGVSDDRLYVVVRVELLSSFAQL